MSQVCPTRPQESLKMRFPHPARLWEAKKMRDLMNFSVCSSKAFGLQIGLGKPQRATRNARDCPRRQQDDLKTVPRRRPESLKTARKGSDFAPRPVQTSQRGFNRAFSGELGRTIAPQTVPRPRTLETRKRARISPLSHEEAPRRAPR